MIYFVGGNELPGYVKIGYTTGSIAARIASLQTGSPFGLELLASCHGNYDLEQAIHRFLRADHVRGEWFYRWGEAATLIRICREMELTASDIICRLCYEREAGKDYALPAELTNCDYDHFPALRAKSPAV